MIARWLPILSVAAAGVALALTVTLVFQFEREQAERRDQLCGLFEADHLADVKVLQGRYRLLSDPDRRALLGPGLTRLVVLGLGEIEREARTDTAPEFCDAAGVGLPEPDPVLPARRDFKYLLTP